LIGTEQRRPNQIEYMDVDNLPFASARFVLPALFIFDFSGKIFVS